MAETSQEVTEGKDFPAEVNGGGFGSDIVKITEIWVVCIGVCIGEGRRWVLNGVVWVVNYWFDLLAGLLNLVGNFGRYVKITILPLF